MKALQERMSLRGDESPEAHNKNLYLESLRLIERLHRRLLDIIKARLDEVNHTDINSVQALLLYNIGADELTAGELRSRGYYLGSNVSYNLKKLVESGHIVQERSTHDRRSVRIRLSDKGFIVSALVDAIYTDHLNAINDDSVMGMDRLGSLNEALRMLEGFWTAQIRFDTF